MSQNRFNIRVYGILINQFSEILIADEVRGGHFFTKFPGGGLEWGEGLKDCLIREFQEELGIGIEIGDLFYCTDFFVASAFKNTDQLISIYYKVNFDQVNQLHFEGYSIPLTEEGERFRWLPIGELSEDVFTFPIDKIVAEQLKRQFLT